MKTIWVSIAIIAALLSACGENQQAPQAQNEPTKQAIKGADRYYVLDWKSNHLGYTSADYDCAPIAAAMAGIEITSMPAIA